MYFNLSNEKKFFSLFIKILFLIILLWIFYGFYLNFLIKQRLEGKVWKLPAIIYGQITNLEPGMPYEKKDMEFLLKKTRYYKVLHTKNSGEFSVKKNTIELIRRPFHFPDNKEDKMHVLLFFEKGLLKEIKDLDKNTYLNFFRIEPILITTLQSSNYEQRIFMPRSSFPNILINILLITEDKNFYQHNGISLSSIFRALVKNINLGRTVQGGSTLTQQLAKNLFLTNARSLWRKINEAYISIIIEFRYSKDFILELYLNEIYLGQVGQEQIRGFPLASLYYFGRPINELSLDQYALLVGMVKGASLYNPWKNPKLSWERRNLILRLLLQNNIIDEKNYNIFSKYTLNIENQGSIITPHPAFVNMVYNELKKNIKIKNFSGIKIFTTLDIISQLSAEKAIEKEIPILKKQKKLDDLESSIVIIDRFSGEVRAMIGGSSVHFSGYNRALLSRRSIGSLAKPAIYLTALNNPDKYDLNTLIDDIPIFIKESNGKVWQPNNENHKFSGRVMLIDALIHSMNVPTVKLGMSLGLNNITRTWIKLGIKKEIIKTVPSMLLGSLNLTPIEVAQTFQTIANGGNRTIITALNSVLSEEGSLLFQNFSQSNKTESEQASYLTIYAMQQVAIKGTAKTLGNKYPYFGIAAKTGTTNNLIDSWFAGIDGKEVSIIWVGRDNNKPANLYGSSGAMQIYLHYLNNKKPVPLKIKMPNEIVLMNTDANGKIVCKNSGNNTFPMWVHNKTKNFCKLN